MLTIERRALIVAIVACVLPAATIAQQVPGGLEGAWTVVPLPMSSWGLKELPRAGTVRIEKDSAGRMRAAALIGQQTTPTDCTPMIPVSAVQLPFAAADFSSGVAGPAGNRFGTFAGGGATISQRRTRTSDGVGRALRLEPSFPEGKGWAGLWIELAPPASLTDPDAGVDLSAATELVVEGNGLRGVVAASDPGASRRDEPVELGRIESPGSGGSPGVVRIPLTGASLDRKRLRSVVVNLTGSEAPVEISRIWFSSGDGVAPPVRRVANAGAIPTARGVWIWNTTDFLAAPSRELQSFDTLNAGWKFSEVYLQLPDGEWSKGERGRSLALLIYELRRRGMRVHALEGAARFALASEHRSVQRRLRSVVEFNQYWGIDASFEALHLDIEPYLLPDFGSARRAVVLSQLTDLLRAVKRENPELPLWLDIPFWYDEAPDHGHGSDRCPMRRFLGDAIRIADGIVVMSYRTFADGADGVAAHATGELELAARLGRASRFALESVPLPPEDAWTVTLDGMPASGHGGPAALLSQKGSPHLLVTERLGEGDAARLEQADAYRRLRIEFAPGPSPAKVTFHGRPARDMWATADDAAQLLLDAGIAFGGVAYHELRTLPRP